MNRPLIISEVVYLIIVLLIGLATLMQTFVLMLTYYQKGFMKTSYLSEFYESILLVLTLILGLFLNKSIFAHNTIGFTLLLLTIIFIFFRSLYCFNNLFRSIKNDISAVSIVFAIDTIKTGLLVYKDNGQILLINNQMQELMLLLTNKTFRNANDFEDYFKNKENSLLFIKEDLDGQNAYILSNKNVWMFSQKEIIIKNCHYHHLIASDVTTLWKLKAKLDEKNVQLEKKSIQLKKTIDNLYIASKVKEIEYFSSRVHDILGQHLSLMLRTIESGEQLDIKTIKSMADNLLILIVEEDINEKSYDKFLGIKNMFNVIGVNISLIGILPKDKKRANLIIDLIRESTTNAVRHGFASQINVNLELKPKYIKVEIANNGYSPKDRITFGSGINEMKRKVIEIGGNFNIIQTPIFKVIAIIPGGELHDNCINS